MGYEARRPYHKEIQRMHRVHERGLPRARSADVADTDPALLEFLFRKLCLYVMENSTFDTSQLRMPNGSTVLVIGSSGSGVSRYLP